MTYELVLVTVPPEDDYLSVLSRAWILIYPYFRRNLCLERYSLADRAEMEDLLMANPDYFAVPFACHW